MFVREACHECMLGWVHGAESKGSPKTKLPVFDGKPKCVPGMQGVCLCGFGEIKQIGYKCSNGPLIECIQVRWRGETEVENGFQQANCSHGLCVAGCVGT